MKSTQASALNRQVYYRLVALWVLCESMLGGIIHALRIPVSGLIVGSAAVICICMIAYYVPVKGAVIRATVIVAVFKIMLSPQAPLLAYFAVFFQGLMGEMLFWKRSFYRLSCFLLGLIALLESGFQRIIVLTVVYGNNFWKVINDFINGLTGQRTFTNYSLYIGAAYVILHIIAGMLVGWWAGTVPQKISTWQQRIQEDKIVIAKERNDLKYTRKSKRFKKGMMIIWIILFLLYLQSYFRIGEPLLPSRLPLQIFIRSVIIILTWFFLAGPALNWLLKKWLLKKQERAKQEIEAITKVLPAMRSIFISGWRSAATSKGFKRVILCCKIILASALDKDHG